MQAVKVAHLGLCISLPERARQAPSSPTSQISKLRLRDLRSQVQRVAEPGLTPGVPGLMSGISSLICVACVTVEVCLQMAVNQPWWEAAPGTPEKQSKPVASFTPPPSVPAAASGPSLAPSCPLPPALYSSAA